MAWIQDGLRAAKRRFGEPPGEGGVPYGGGQARARLGGNQEFPGGEVLLNEQNAQRHAGAADLKALHARPPPCLFLDVFWTLLLLFGVCGGAWGHTWDTPWEDEA